MNAPCKPGDAAGQFSNSLPIQSSWLAGCKTDGEVKRVAGEFFLNRGNVETRSQNLYEMVFDKPTKSRRSRRALRVRLRMHKLSEETRRLIGTPLGVDGWRTDLESETVLLEGAGQIQSFLIEIKSRVESLR